MKKLTTREMAYCALFAALTAVCSQIQIPLPLIPINLAIFAVVLCGGLLRPVCALLAVGVYVLLGLVGIPVFAGFKAGVGTLFGNTGGYIVGFLFTAIAVGVVSDYVRPKNDWARAGILAVSMAVGIALCYAFGTVWFMYVYNAGAESTVTLAGALSMCVLPYLLPDLVKIVCAAVLVAKFKRFMKIRG